MILEALLLALAILFSAMISVCGTMLVTVLIRKNGIDDIDPVNIVMAGVCVFAMVLPIVFTMLAS